MLTAKQEKFVINLINGMSQRQAYKDAYNANNMSDNAIDREACLLCKSPKIAQRHKELANELAKPAIMTAQERLELLTKIARGEEKERTTIVIDGDVKAIEEPASIKNRMGAMDLMNKMQGEYVKKIEGDLKVSKLEDLI